MVPVAPLDGGEVDVVGGAPAEQAEEGADHFGVVDEGHRRLGGGQVGARRAAERHVDRGLGVAQQAQFAVQRHGRHDVPTAGILVTGQEVDVGDLEWRRFERLPRADEAKQRRIVGLHVGGQRIDAGERLEAGEVDRAETQQAAQLVAPGVSGDRRVVKHQPVGLPGGAHVHLGEQPAVVGDAGQCNHERGVEFGERRLRSQGWEEQGEQIVGVAHRSTEPAPQSDEAVQLGVLALGQRVGRIVG